MNLKMKKTTARQNAIATLTALALSICPYGRARAVPVVDFTNLVPNTVSAVFEGLMTEEQAKVLTNVIHQFTLAKTNAQKAKSWTDLINQLTALKQQANTLSKWTKESGSIEAHLLKFKSQNDFLRHKCFSRQGCSEAEKRQIEENDRLVSVAETVAAENALKNSAKTQKDLKQDGESLAKLQGASRNAQGHMEAADYQNQLSSQQNGQILGLRKQMTDYQVMTTTRSQAKAHRREKKRAHSKAIRQARVEDSKAVKW